MRPGQVGILTSGGSNRNPLAYGNNLKFWLNGQTRVFNSNLASFRWESLISATSRALIVFVTYEGTARLNAVTYGGRPMTRIRGVYVTTTGLGDLDGDESALDDGAVVRLGMAAYILDQAQFALATSTTISTFYTGGTNTEEAIFAGVYNNVLQPMSSTIVASSERYTPTANTQLGDGGLGDNAALNQSTVANGQIVACAAVDNLNSFTWGAALSEALDFQATAGSSDLSASLATSTGTGATKSVDPNHNGTTGRALMIALSIAPAAGATAGIAVSWQQVNGGGSLAIPSDADFVPDGSDAGYPDIVTGINGLQSVEFTQAGFENRALNNAAAFDNLWAGSGSKSIAFAAEVTEAHGGGSLAPIISKEGSNAISTRRGWALGLTPAGAFQFTHQNSTGSVWSIQTGTGLFTIGSKILGYLTWDGVLATSPNLTLRLWNGSVFATISFTVTDQANKTKGDDSAAPLVVGNRDPAFFDFRWPGWIADVWYTKPAVNSVTESYLQRYI